MMLMAVPILPKPDDSSDKIQKSVLCPTRECFRGEGRISEPTDVRRVSGPVQSVAAEKAEIQRSPPRALIQKLNALRRGNAISRAPIISGTR